MVSGISHMQMTAGRQAGLGVGGVGWWGGGGWQAGEGMDGVGGRMVGYSVG